MMAEGTDPFVPNDLRLGVAAEGARVAAVSNEAIRAHEQRGVLVALQQRFVGERVDLLSDTRVTLREADTDEGADKDMDEDASSAAALVPAALGKGDKNDDADATDAAPPMPKPEKLKPS